MEMVAAHATVIVPEVLKSNNYKRWSIFMRHYLEGQDLGDVVRLSPLPTKRNTREWIKKNALALHAIKISCGEEMFNKIKDMDSADEVWDALANIHKPPVSQEIAEHLLRRRTGTFTTQSFRNIGRSQFETLANAISNGNRWRVRDFLTENPNARSAGIFENGYTALHLSVYNRKEIIVNYLIDSALSKEELEIKDDFGSTALSIAARFGAGKSIAQKLVGKNPNLLTIPDDDGKIPVQLACSTTHEDMARYLYVATPLESLNRDRGFYILRECISRKMFDIAFDLLQRFPELVSYGCSSDSISLIFYGCSSDSISLILTLAQTPPPFFKGSNLSFWERWIYDCIRVKAYSIKEDEHGSCVQKIRDFYQSCKKKIRVFFQSCEQRSRQIAAVCWKQRNAAAAPVPAAPLPPASEPEPLLPPRPAEPAKPPAPEPAKPLPPPQPTEPGPSTPVHLSPPNSTPSTPAHPSPPNSTPSTPANPPPPEPESSAPPSLPCSTPRPAYAVACFKVMNQLREALYLFAAESLRFFLVIFLVLPAVMMIFMTFILCNRILGASSTLLRYFARDLYKLKLMDAYARKVIRLICGESFSKLDAIQFGQSTAVKAILQAIKSGIPDIVRGIAYANVNILRSITDPEDSSRNIFACAIEHHQEEVARFLYWFAEEETNMVMAVDEDKNNILHLAAKLAPPYQLDCISGSALQLQSELRWFKGVEEIVPRSYREHQNNNGETPLEVFVREHKNKLKEAEEWVKKSAESSTVVGALIITIMFAAAFTVPGGQDQSTGFPIFLHKTPVPFMVFIVSDAISLFAASSSVIMFLGILTSRFAYEDFHKSLPIRLVMGLSSLFISIATMTMAFSAALVIMLEGRLGVVIPITLLAGIPVTFFVVLQFPLLVEIYVSTSRPNIFDRQERSWVGKMIERPELREVVLLLRQVACFFNQPNRQGI